MKRNRNQTTATLPAAAKKAGESKPGKKLKPGPKEKRKNRRSTPEQRKAVRAVARGIIEKCELETYAADDQQYKQHTKQQMCKLADVPIDWGVFYRRIVYKRYQNFAVPYHLRS